MEDRRFWPSAGYLAELRSRGRFPFSPMAVWAAFVIGAVLGLSMMQGRLLLAYGIWLELVADPALCSLAEGGLCRKLLLHVSQVLLWPAIIALLCALIVGLLQTRFDFRFHFWALESRRQRYSWRLVLILCGIGVWMGSFFLSFYTFRLFLSNDLAYFMNYAPKALKMFAMAFIAVLFVLGVVGWVLEQLRFRIAHRMTAQERFSG